jgi:hypothetical protein
MVLAMAAGMIILGPVVEVVGTALGVGEFLTQPDIAAVVMASSPASSVAPDERGRPNRFGRSLRTDRTEEMTYSATSLPYVSVHQAGVGLSAIPR